MHQKMLHTYSTYIIVSSEYDERAYESYSYMY